MRCLICQETQGNCQAFFVTFLNECTKVCFNVFGEIRMTSNVTKTMLPRNFILTKNMLHILSPPVFCTCIGGSCDVHIRDCILTSNMLPLFVNACILQWKLWILDATCLLNISIKLLSTRKKCYSLFILFMLYCAFLLFSLFCTTAW
jgi:hypothetical protein